MTHLFFRWSNIRRETVLTRYLMKGILQKCLHCITQWEDVRVIMTQSNVTEWKDTTILLYWNCISKTDTSPRRERVELQITSCKHEQSQIRDKHAKECIKRWKRFFTKRSIEEEKRQHESRVAKLQLREINIPPSCVTVELARDQKLRQQSYKNAEHHAVLNQEICDYRTTVDSFFFLKAKNGTEAAETNLIKRASEVLRLAGETFSKRHESVRFSEACHNGLLRLIYLKHTRVMLYRSARN